MDARRRYFYRLQVEGWHGQHALVLRNGYPRVYVEAALYATLARLRRYPTRWELLRGNDMSQAEDLACIRSLLDGTGAGNSTRKRVPAWSIRAAALYLRWQELDGTPEGPDPCCQG